MAAGTLHRQTHLSTSSPCCKGAAAATPSTGAPHVTLQFTGKLEMAAGMLTGTWSSTAGGVASATSSHGSFRLQLLMHAPAAAAAQAVQ